MSCSVGFSRKALTALLLLALAAAPIAAKVFLTVDAALKQSLVSGRYFELYEKWFGPKGEVPYPMTAEIKRFLLSQK